MRGGGEHLQDILPQGWWPWPRRRRCLAALWLFNAWFGCWFGFPAFAWLTRSAFPLFAGDDRKMNRTFKTLAASLLATTTFILFAFAGPLFSRSQATAVLVLVGAFVAEKLVGIFIGDGVAYLPVGGCTPLLRLEGLVIGAVPAAVALALTTLALVATAAALFTRRDITP